MVAVRHNGQIALATDSQWTSSNQVGHCVQSKVIKHNGTILAAAGSAGLTDAACRALLSFMEAGDDWHERWSDHCLGREETDPMQRLAERGGVGAILLVWRTRILEVWLDGTIFESADPIAAVGAGQDVALGAAWALMPLYRSARTIAKKAVEVACKLNIYCGLPVVCETVSIR